MSDRTRSTSRRSLGANQRSPCVASGFCALRAARERPPAAWRKWATVVGLSSGKLAWRATRSRGGWAHPRMSAAVLATEKRGSRRSASRSSASHSDADEVDEVAAEDPDAADDTPPAAAEESACSERRTRSS